MINNFAFNLQDAMCFLMEQLTFFHDHAMFLMLLVISLVSYLMFITITNSMVNLKLLFNESIETLWTLLPGAVLMFIALPSLKVLYLTDDILEPSLTIKVVGHQWFWSYEYSDFENLEFDSYMKSNSDLTEFRCLDVDNRVVIPVDLKVRVVVTSSDVIHSWTVPALGVKVDANPGRLNQCMLSCGYHGLLFGQCSEICGVLHSFMPICLEAVIVSDFLEWLLKIMRITY